VTVLEVRTDDLRTTRFTDHTPVPADGEIVARVRHFGLSANNITYGLLGEMVGYWRVFPAEPGWGRLPMWGVAEVVASAHPDIAEGGLLFGYVPMATHVTLTPGKVRDGGFTDVSAHRQALAPAYNNYRRLDADPLYDPEHPGELPLFLPLFALSFSSTPTSPTRRARSSSPAPPARRRWASRGCSPPAVSRSSRSPRPATPRSSRASASTRTP
jgi:hypothetical protein